MTMASDICEIHKMTKMNFKGQVVCPRCYLENESKKLQEHEQTKWEADQTNKQKQLFHQQSMIADSNIRKANFDNYKPTSEEGAKNLELAKVIAKDYRSGKVFNTIMAGNCGAGKRILLTLSQKNLQELVYQSCLSQSVNCYGRLKVRSIKIPH